VFKVSERIERIGTIALGRFVERRWEGHPGAYGGRRARASGSYRAFVPDPIEALDPPTTFEAADAVAAAEQAVRDLNASGSVTGLEAIGALLLRSEAIASSRIEGYELSQRNLARALIDPRAARGTARTVAANVVAMEEAIALGETDRSLTGDDIRAVHRTLMAGEPDRVRPGEYRHEQNWIGGRLDSPIDARYIPPPEAEVEGLMADLAAFINRDDLPGVAQAAIAHAQFETIHPFLDGNGRVGRCLIHVVLRRRGVAPRFVPPVSVVLAARANSYVAGLVGFRDGRTSEWCASFAGACERAARLSTELAEDIARLEADWFGRAGRPRRDSAAARIIAALPAQPITSAATIRAAIGASHQRALDGLKALADSGVVRQITEGGYDRQFAADELFALLEAYEDRIAAAA
jgi:Fic family protein